MNIVKRTFNPLLAKEFDYKQSENAELKYSGNWGPVAQANTITASTWTVENGTVTVSGAALASNVTSAIISGSPGCSRIVNKVTFTDGQVDERIINLTITDNSESCGCDYDYGICCGG